MEAIIQSTAGHVHVTVLTFYVYLLCFSKQPFKVVITLHLIYVSKTIQLENDGAKTQT